VGDDGTARRAYEALDALKGGQDAGVALDLAYVALRTQDPALAARVAPRIVDAPDVYAGLLALTDGLAAALDALALAQAEAPRDRRLALRRAEVLAAAGQLDGALAALAAIPGLPPATLARLQAGTLAKSGDRDGALGLVVPHGSDQAAARLQVRLLLELGRPAEALQIAESGLALWPDDPLLPVRRVLALEGVGRTPEALAVALGLAERHPEDVDLALVQSRLSPPSLAGIATLQRALEAHPAEPELWLELARSEWVSGSQEAARFAAQRAGQLLGRDTPPGERYARMCAALPCTPSDPKERP
jgi:tetratricopeptide (TPR) repeat protein